MSKVKNCISRLCTGPFTHESHYCWKQSFRVFGTGFDRPSARLQAAKTTFCILFGIDCHGIPACTLQSGYRRVTEVAKTANITKMAEKCINCSCHSAPYKPHGVGTRKHFFGSTSKKTKRLMIFRPKRRGGVIFSTFLTPPPPSPPNLPQNLKKLGFKWGALGGSGPKTHWGMCLLDKIMILQGVKQTIQPLEVGYTNSPKKAQKGVCVVCSPTCGHAWL